MSELQTQASSQPEPRPLDPQLALAIAAAARQLPDLTPAQLVEILLRISNGELTATALASLTPKSLRKAGGDLLNDADGGSLRAALELLQGEALASIDSPEVSSAELSGSRMPLAATVTATESGIWSPTPAAPYCRRSASFPPPSSPTVTAPVPVA